MDWSRLSPPDFEDLVGDLLQAEWSIRLERFARGRDGGIDLRHRTNSVLTVVQCKHYADSGLSRLMTSIRREAQRLPTIKPGRYVLATSVDLSPDNKTDVLNVCRPYIRSVGDVLGASDIEALLRKHPTVEASHPRLWAQTAEVLRRLLNAATFTDSAWTVEQAESDIRIFVRPASFEDARTMLRQKHACIIAGSPGIGKTTLARMLLLEYVREGFEPICLRESVDEGIHLYQPDARQVFYFDDFLGQTDITEQSLGRNEDGRLVRFVERVQSGQNKRLIMTTREYVLRDALRIYERMQRARQDGVLSTIVLDLGRYSRLDRARVLYNHLWALVGADSMYGHAFLTSDAWKPIVDHAGFNPRVISIALSRAIRRQIAPSMVPTEVQALLSNPADVWRTAFHGHLNGIEREVLRAVVMLPEGASYNDLFAALVGRASEVGVHGATRDAFRAALEVLEGDFLAIGRGSGGAVHIRLANPSVRDFLLSDATDDGARLDEWMESSIWLSSIYELLRCISWGLSRAGDVSIPLRWIVSRWDRLMIRIREVVAESPVESGRPVWWNHGDVAGVLEDIWRGRQSSGWGVDQIAALSIAWPDLHRWAKAAGVNRLLSTLPMNQELASVWIDASIEEADWSGLEEFAELFSTRPELFGDAHRELLAQVFDDLSADELHQALREDKDEDDALGRLSAIERVADLLDRPSPVDSSDRREVRDRFQWRRDGEDFVEGGNPSRTVAGGIGDAEIRRLFSTLVIADG